MEAYVTPVLAVPEWARKAGHLLLVASLAPAGPLPEAISEAWMRGIVAVDHHMFALAHATCAMRGGSTWEQVCFDLVLSGVGAENVPDKSEVIPYLGRGQLG